MQRIEQFHKKSFWLLMLPFIVILSFFTLGFLSVLALRWFTPPTSSFMVQAHIYKVRYEQTTPIKYQCTDWQKISPFMPLAIVAAEDQKFRNHGGFDFESISKAVERNKREIRQRGASTITQQVAKNMFLWPGKSYFRKGLEAYFTVLLELLLPKKRILEIYMNVTEFGHGIYGVTAAATVFWDKQPINLTKQDCALLAAVLPSPKRFLANNPSPYILERAAWIQTQMDQLGGVNYLQELDK